MAEPDDVGIFHILPNPILRGKLAIIRIFRRNIVSRIVAQHTEGSSAPDLDGHKRLMLNARRVAVINNENFNRLFLHDSNHDEF